MDLNAKESSQNTQTELVAPAEERGAIVNPRREAFEKSDGDVAVMEGQCLAEVAARGVDASRISSKVAVGSKQVRQETISGEIRDQNIL